MKVIIDPEFSALIPPLTTDELEQLEANIIADGCREPLTLWKNILIDGHNRYEICTRNNIEFTTVTVDLPDREAVMDWMDTNQLGRRNLSHDVQSILRGRVYERSKGKAEDNLKRGDKTPKSQTATSGDVAAVLAEKHKVHRATIIRDGKNAQTYERLQREQPEAARAVWCGEKQLRAAKHELDRAEVRDAGKLPTNKYRVIYADPPWKYSNTGLTNSAARHYLTMSTEDLCARDSSDDFASQVRAVAEDNAVLFLWATVPMLPDALRVAAAWGFEYKTHFVWDKVKHNRGNYTSVRHELLIIAVRGSCPPDSRELIDSVQVIPRGKHSEKPEDFRDIIDRLYTNGQRLELFARGDVPANWTAWGNQAAVTPIYYEDLTEEQLELLEQDPPPDEIAAISRDIFAWCRWEWARSAASKSNPELT